VQLQIKSRTGSTPKIELPLIDNMHYKVHQHDYPHHNINKASGLEGAIQQSMHSKSELQHFYRDGLRPVAQMITNFFTTPTRSSQLLTKNIHDAAQYHTTL
jgi:hypothetical protein